jgi:hypothetical protein
MHIVLAGPNANPGEMEHAAEKGRRARKSFACGGMRMGGAATAWRYRLAIVALAISALTGVFAAGPTSKVTRHEVLAQFPIPGLPNINTAKDTAIRQALSEFGASIGQQMPIVVRTSDAYPTTQLQGAPFSPQSLPLNLASALRASPDGTVALPPGDYEFTVAVFCMKSYAHSPSGHRYLVAPLHGAAADVFRALNSRLPSLSLDHFAVQVLSWDIQAGLSYSEMRPAQRKIVDQVIPDFKGRLNSDLYQQIRDQYQRVVGRVPGMPSFEDALGRLGPAGQELLQLQALRQQMMQPPQSPEQLARELVPFASLIPSEAGGSGATPWSRYSDRVLVRFITSGNYATPGMYQARVMPPQGAAGGGPQIIAFANIANDPPQGMVSDNGSSNVPFSNIVNNPGNAGVQPLTQSPSGGANPGPSPHPEATPTPNVFITSETVAKVPSDRTRTMVGVNEEVILTFSGANADWSISSSGNGSVDPVGKHVTYRASITPTTEWIKATDTATSQTATIEFNVIAPTAVEDEFLSLEHDQGRPDIGMYVFAYFQPDTVSFQYIDVKELERPAAADGVYKEFNGWGHEPNLVPLPIVEVVPGRGSRWAGTDHIWSGDPIHAKVPFVPGTETFNIPYVYGTLHDGTNGPFYPMGTVVQQCMLLPDGQTLRATKAGANAYSKVSNPDNT